MSTVWFVEATGMRSDGSTVDMGALMCKDSRKLACRVGEEILRFNGVKAKCDWSGPEQGTHAWTKTNPNGTDGEIIQGHVRLSRHKVVRKAKKW